MRWDWMCLVAAFFCLGLQIDVRNNIIKNVLGVCNIVLCLAAIFLSQL